LIVPSESTKITLDFGRYLFYILLDTGETILAGAHGTRGFHGTRSKPLR